MKKQNTGLILFFLILFNFSHAQSVGTDSRGKDVYNFYTTKTLSLPLSSSNSSIKLGYNFPVGYHNGKNGKQFYVKSFYSLTKAGLTGTLGMNRQTGRPLTISDLNQSLVTDSSVIEPLIRDGFITVDSTNFTVAESHSLNISASASNLGNNLSNISTFHPTYGLTIGYSKNIDVFNSWSNIKTLSRPFTSTWSISAYANLNNLLIYDTLNATANREHPVTAGILGEIGLYPVSTRIIAISFSANYEHGTNISNLKNYQKNHPSYENASVISLGDYVGKVGDLSYPDIYRFRVSFPIFIDGFKSPQQFDSDKLLNKLTHLCVIPYYAVYGAGGSRASNELGWFVDLLGQGFGYKNAKIVSGGGVGIDWINAGGGWSHANIFISGNLSIESFFRHEKNKTSSI